MKDKKPTQCLGIWMDHASAHLVEYATDITDADSVSSDFSHQDRVETGHRSENIMHNKEQQKQRLYYEELAAIIKKYDDVLLFGPTNAKDELHNMLKNDHSFDEIHINVEVSDKMTENQERAFVKAYFSKR